MNRFTTKKAIAGALHISRTTLDDYLSKPGAPTETEKGWDSAKVSRWVSKMGKTTGTTAKSNPQMAALKIRELTLKCDRLAHKLETEQGLFIPKAQVGPALRNISLHQRAVLQQKLEQELHNAVDGLKPPERLDRIRSIVDEVCSIFMEGTKEWAAEALEQQQEKAA